MVKQVMASETPPYCLSEVSERTAGGGDHPNAVNCTVGVLDGAVAACPGVHEEILRPVPNAVNVRLSSGTAEGDEKTAFGHNPSVDG